MSVISRITFLCLFLSISFFLAIFAMPWSPWSETATQIDEGWKNLAFLGGIFATLFIVYRLYATFSGRPGGFKRGVGHRHKE